MNREKLIARWPLYEITLDGISQIYKNEGWFNLKTNYGTLFLHEEKKQLSDQEVLNLDKQHLSFIKTLELRKKYPNIYISLNENLKEVTCWLNVNNQDREGLGTLKYSSEQDMINFLVNCNQKAEDAFKDPNKSFICSCCKQTLGIHENDSKNINRLLDENHRFLKFKDAGAGWYCSYCVENDKGTKEEFNLYQKMGSKYYD